MNDSSELLPSTLDLNGPIDFERLKIDVEEHGPLRISNVASPFQVFVTPTPCRCSDQGCQEELVMVSRQNGLFETQWIVSMDEFLEFESLNQFYEYVIDGELHDSRGERMIMEQHIERVVQAANEANAELNCHCAKCLASHVEDDPRIILLLSHLASLLSERRDFLADAREWDNEDVEPNSTGGEPETDDAATLEGWVESAIELGYSLGRIFSEYSGIAQIEPLALLGLKTEADQKKRDLASGQQSSNARKKRRADLFQKIENLAARNPDIVKFGAQDVARLAVQECIDENKRLWSQGAGQAGEYLGEIRRGEAGEKMKTRYKVLFGDKPLKRF